MDVALRKLLFLLVIGLGLAACGGEDEAASDSVIEESTATEAPEETTTTTTTAAPTTTTTTTTTTSTTAAPEATAPATAGSAGIADFGSMITSESLVDPSDDIASCIEDGLGQTGDFATLSPSDQVQTIEVGIDCAGERARPAFLGSFENSAANGNLLDAIGAEAGDCFFDAIAVDDADQTNRIAALVYANAEQPAPEAAIDPGANLLADCADFNVVFSALAGDDPTLQAGIDQTCVDETFDRPAAVGLYSTLLADPAATQGDEVTQSFSALFACFSVGELLVEQFGATDLISEEEIACIDEIFQSPEIVSGLVQSGGSGELPPEALGALLGCLDPETLGGFLGGN